MKKVFGNTINFIKNQNIKKIKRYNSWDHVTVFWNVLQYKNWIKSIDFFLNYIMRKNNKANIIFTIILKNIYCFKNNIITVKALCYYCFYIKWDLVIILDSIQT